MVRLIIPKGETYEVAANTTPPQVVTIEGPFEVVGEGFNWNGSWVDHGEYIRIGTTWAETLPFLREEMAITIPMASVLGFLLALSWFKKIL